MLAVIVGLALVVMIVAAHAPHVTGGWVRSLMYLDLLIPLLPLAGLSAGVPYRWVHATGAGGLVGVAVYALALAAMFVGLAVAWLWTDPAGLGMLALGGVTALLGVAFSIVAVAAYCDDPQEGWRVRRPLTAASAGALTTGAVLLWRGPGDWSSTSSTLTLYSLPVVVMASAFALAILRLACEDRVARQQTAADSSRDRTQRAVQGAGRLDPQHSPCHPPLNGAGSSF